MLKEICKVTETDCFDSWKLSKSHLVLEKRNPSKTKQHFSACKKSLILELLHRQEFNANILLADNLGK
jgi:hypothetical protein